MMLVLHGSIYAPAETADDDLPPEPMTPGTDTLVRLEDIRKRFRMRGVVDGILRRPGRDVLALDGVSLEIRPGEVLGLLGSNGAGKTTLLNICCDLVRPDAGRVQIAGHSVPKEGHEARAKLGIVTTNDRSFFWRLNARENLLFFASLYGLSKADARRRSDDLLERFGLSEASGRPFATYSTGMRKRLALARTLLHDPMVLLMDESTSGLDAEGRELLINLVRNEFAGTGRAVLWATHLMDEIPLLCDNVVVLSKGQLCFSGSVAEFEERQLSGIGTRIGFVLRHPDDAGLQALARDVRGTLSESASGMTLVVPERMRDDGAWEVIDRLRRLGGEVRSIEEDALPLTELFTRLEMNRAGHDAPGLSQ